MRSFAQRFGLSFVLAAMLVMLAGCGGPSLVGKWDSAVAVQGGGKAVTEFKADNTFSMNLQSPMLPAAITVSGTYKVEGNKLTINSNDVTAPGVAPALMAMIKANAKQSDTSTFKFADNDTVEMTGSKGATTMKRIKETK